MNLGYKRLDPSHPCRRCWSKFAKPFQGPLVTAYTTQSSSSSSTFQRPLPTFNPPQHTTPLLPALNLSLQPPQPRTYPCPEIQIFKSRHYHRTALPHLAVLWYIAQGIHVSVAGFVGDARGRGVSVCFCLTAQHVLIAEAWGGYLDRGRTDTFCFVFLLLGFSLDFFPSYTDRVYVPV
jgi:hypothetical protein